MGAGRAGRESEEESEELEDEGEEKMVEEEMAGAVTGGRKGEEDTGMRVR